MSNESRTKAFLKRDEYFKYGQRYYIEFQYENPEDQQRIYEVFTHELIPAVGSKSQRFKSGQEFIMPYLVDENGNMTAENSEVVGGTSIPEDLLPEFIRRLVEYDGITLICGNKTMNGTFDEKEFQGMVETLGIRAELKKGALYEEGIHYYIEFNYSSEEQKRKIFEIFNRELIPTVGSKSPRFKSGQEFIMPYLIDKNGNMTAENTGVVGGTSIPEDLLPDVLKRLVELDGVILKCGDKRMSGAFDEDEYEKMKSTIETTAELKKGEYFDYGEQYYIEFRYGTKEEQQRIYNVFTQELIPAIGSKSPRFKSGQEYIMPYLVDETGTITAENSEVVGGTSIPEDLLPEFIRRLVEYDGITLKVGEESMSKRFDETNFNEMKNSLNQQHKGSK